MKTGCAPAGVLGGKSSGRRGQGFPRGDVLPPFWPRLVHAEEAPCDHDVHEEQEDTPEKAVECLQVSSPNCNERVEAGSRATTANVT